MFKPEEGKFCQSCGMPLESSKDSGTNADGTLNPKYCHYCFRNGKFLEPDITVDEMIEKVVRIMKLTKMPEQQVREVAKSFIPSLERWRN